jgi:hypothetical protein
MELISTPGSVTVTSAPSWRVQASAVAAVVGMVVLGCIAQTGERLVCDERGECTLREERLVGSKTKHLGSAERIVSVEGHRRSVEGHRRSGRRNRHPTWSLVLSAPEERVVVDKAIATMVDGWLDGRLYQEGQKKPAKALPFRASWRAGGLTIGLCLLLGVIVAIFLLRSVVRYELSVRGGQVKRRVTRLFVWTRDTALAQPLQFRPRHFEILPWRRKRSWGVWCETTPGAGHWVAVGLTEGEAEAVVDAVAWVSAV